MERFPPLPIRTRGSGWLNRQSDCLHLAVGALQFTVDLSEFRGSRIYELVPNRQKYCYESYTLSKACLVNSWRNRSIFTWITILESTSLTTMLSLSSPDTSVLHTTTSYVNTAPMVVVSSSYFGSKVKLKRRTEWQSPFLALISSVSETTSSPTAYSDDLLVSRTSQFGLSLLYFSLTHVPSIFHLRQKTNLYIFYNNKRDCHLLLLLV